MHHRNLHRGSIRARPPIWFPEPRRIPTLLLTCALALTGCTSQRAQAERTLSQQASPVRLEPVQHGPVQRKILLLGRLAAKSELSLGFKLGGVVRRVSVREGQRVKKGQVLAKLDPTEVSAEVERAQGLLEKATRDYELARTLHGARSVPQVDLQNAQTAFVLAQAGKRVARFNRKQTVLVAPEDGIILSRRVEVAEVIAPGQAVIRMMGVSRPIVRAAVADRDVLQMRVGEPAKVTFDALPRESFAASLSTILSAANPATGMFEVEFALEKDLGPLLLSGLAAKVELQREETPSAVVPVGALVDGNDERSAVYLVSDARAKRVDVELAFLFGEYAALARGLEQEGMVVTHGADGLTDGAAVRIVK